MILYQVLAHDAQAGEVGFQVLVVGVFRDDDFDVTADGNPGAAVGNPAELLPVIVHVFSFHVDVSVPEETHHVCFRGYHRQSYPVVQG